MLCFIFMFLIMILCIEKIVITLINKLLTTIIRCIDKQVQWIYFYRFVIIVVHIKNVNCFELNKLTFNTQINNIFYRAFLFYNIIKLFVLHNLRREVVSDMKHIKKLKRKFDKTNDEMTIMLNYLKTAYSRSLTDIYFEHVISNMWLSKIIKMKNENSFDFINIHEFYKKWKFLFNVIDKICEKQKFNFNHQLLWKWMIKKIHVDNLVQWRFLNQFKNFFKSKFNRLFISFFFKFTLIQYYWHF